MNTDVDYIRKVASLRSGREFLVDEPVEVPTVSALLLHKAGSATDKVLLKIASELPGDALRNYEELGGEFKKEGIGTPMFNAQAAPPVQAQMQPQAQAGMGGPKPPTPKLQGPKPGQGNQLGSVPSISTPSEPKIPGQSLGAGGGMGKTGAACAPKHKKAKESAISSEGISLKQQSYPPPQAASQYSQGVGQLGMAESGKMAAVKEALKRRTIAKVISGVKDPKRLGRFHKGLQKIRARTEAKGKHEWEVGGDRQFSEDLAAAQSNRLRGGIGFEGEKYWLRKYAPKSNPKRVSARRGKR